MKSETLSSTLFANWARRLNVLEKARFIEKRCKKIGIWTAQADQTRLSAAHARTAVSAYRRNVKLLIVWLLNRFQAL